MPLLPLELMQNAHLTKAAKVDGPGSGKIPVTSQKSLRMWSWLTYPQSLEALSRSNVIGVRSAKAFSLVLDYFVAC